MPLVEEMVFILRKFFVYPFDEYYTKQRIICSNIDWSDRQVSD